MSFRFTTLGCSSALPTIKGYPSAHVLSVHEQFYLIDCGEGVQRQLGKMGISPLKIVAIFVTHLHGDHFYGIYGLISTLSLLGRREKLTIYAPAPVREIIDFHTTHFEPNLGYELEVVELDSSKSEKIYENKVMEVSTIPLNHKIACSGFLFREKNPPLNVKKEIIELYGLDIYQILAAKRGEDVVLEGGEVVENHKITYRPYKPVSFAYCSDTAFSKSVLEEAKGVDLLYHEATFLEKDKKIAAATGHSTAKTASFCAKKSGCKWLVIGHFSNRYKGNSGLFVDECKQNFDNVIVAKELVIIDLKKL